MDVFNEHLIKRRVAAAEGIEPDAHEKQPSTGRGPPGECIWISMEARLEYWNDELLIQVPHIKGINDAIEIVKRTGQNKSHPKPRYIY